MTNLTDKQRAGLTALRDVLRDHDMEIAYMHGSIKIWVGNEGHIVGNYGFYIDEKTASRTLEQETE